MKQAHRQSLGHLGESLAAAYLIKKGYSILERNCHTPHGEIDLIAQLGNVIVFVEVKTRSTRSLGPPEISITLRKQEHMRAAAEYYIQQHPELITDWRIDAITVQMQGKEQQPLIEHFENVTTG
jgi:putative endonuclease